jgi:gliding motility-associated-like protein
VLQKWLLIAALFAGLWLPAQVEFVPNKGQWPEQVLFRTGIGPVTVWLENQGFTYTLIDEAYFASLHPSGDRLPVKVPLRGHSYKVTFDHATAAAGEGADLLKHYYHFYQDNRPEHWAEFVQPYQHACARELYPGIDLHAYASADQLKYDLLVAAGADPSVVSMTYSDDVTLRLSPDGHLLVSTSVGVVRESAPFCYQTIEGRLNEVTCRYEINGQTVRFEIGSYRTDLALVIDPELAFSTYIGSTANNFGFTACDDLDENLIAGAAVFTTGYPTTLGAFDSSFNGPTGPQFSIAGFDAAITKFGPDGTTLLYSTYLGGQSQDTPHSIVVNSQNQFIVMGMTGSSDFPTTAGCAQPSFGGGSNINIADFFTGTAMTEGSDVYVSIFNEDGTLSNSTFMGGAGNDGLNISPFLYYNYGDPFRGEVNVDAEDNIYVATVSSGNFPILPGAMQSTFGGGSSDGVLFRLNPTATFIQYSSYVGGGSADACYAVQFSPNGEVLVGGGTRSANFPHCVGGVDASFDGNTDGFVLLLNQPDLGLIRGTFLGTQEYDQVYFVQSDPDGNIYALGQTTGTMAISGGTYGQADSGLFIRKFNSALTAQVWNTTVGTGSGEVDISPTAFLVSDCYQIYFSGWGGTTNSLACQAYDCQAFQSTTFGLPITEDAFQTTTDGSDFYLCVLAPDATSLVYASYFGGALSAEHVDGGTSRFDKDGSIYQAVCAGCQNNDDFPTTPGAHSTINASSGCNLAVFRFNLGLADADIGVETPAFFCEGENIAFPNESSNANTFEWSFGDGTTSTLVSPTHSYQAPGTYTIRLIAGNGDEVCSIADTAFVTLTIGEGVNPIIAPVDPLCPGEIATLAASGSVNMTWIENATLDATNPQAPIASPEVTTVYFLADSNECETDTVSITVVMLPFSTTISEGDSICAGQTVNLSAGCFPAAGAQYLWSPSTGLNNANIASPTASPTVSTTYTVTITAANGCSASPDVYIDVVFDPPGGNWYEPVNMCENTGVQLTAAPASVYQWSPQEYISPDDAQSVTATPPDTLTFAVQLTNACGSGVDYVTVNVIFPTVWAEGGGDICSGGVTIGRGFGGTDYRWRPADFAQPPDSSVSQLTPPDSRFMFIDIIDENGCIGTDSVYVNVKPLPQVDAGPDQYFDFPGAAQLSGNNFGWPFQWQSDPWLSCSDCLAPVVAPDDITAFYLTVIDDQGCRNTDSVTVVPYFPLWVPNAITPNNDGINDVFKAVGQGIEGFQLVIRDRWGIIVFSSTDINEVWDGGIGDYYVQNDVYIWEISYDTIDRRKSIRGHVTVIR